MIKTLNQSIDLVKKHWRAYLTINLVMYGLIGVGMIIARISPGMHETFHQRMRDLVNSGGLFGAVDIYYVDRNISLAIGFTFIVNLVIGSLYHISLPSLVIPFWGLLFTAFRSIEWGILFGFTGGSIRGFIALGTLIMEGQGYILAAFASWLFWMYVFVPLRSGFLSWKQGYVAGLRATLKIYLLVAIVLFFSAIFEAAGGILTYNPVFPSIKGMRPSLHGKAVGSSYLGSTMFYDADSIKESDAKVIGTLLVDIAYFKRGDTLSARLSKPNANYVVELYLPRALWEKKEVGESFAKMRKKLSEYYPSRKYYIATFCYDETGQRIEKRFE